MVDMIETDKYGYYHATNEGGYISWYDFTKEIFRQAVEPETEHKKSVRVLFKYSDGFFAWISDHQKSSSFR